MSTKYSKLTNSEFQRKIREFYDDNMDFFLELTARHWCFTYDKKGFQLLMPQSDADKLTPGDIVVTREDVERVHGIVLPERNFKL